MRFMSKAMQSMAGQFPPHVEVPGYAFYSNYGKFKTLGGMELGGLMEIQDVLASMQARNPELPTEAVLIQKDETGNGEWAAYVRDDYAWVAERLIASLDEKLAIFERMKGL